MAEFENGKIKGAIRTDFVLSAEIIIIALGTVAHVSLNQQIAVLSVIAIGMTIGVYGLVAAIVKLDDLGLHWQSKPSSNLFNKILNKLGAGLLIFAPRLMQSLTWIGLVAMFLVGGGMLSHNIEWLHHVSLSLTASLGKGISNTIAVTLLDGIYGIITGLAVAAVIHLIPKKKTEAE